MMKKFFRKLIAKILRTFVTDCPKCHGHFFGFHNHAHQVKIEGIHYRIVCHRCNQKYLGGIKP